MSAYKWQFVPRFRRQAFGWRSDTPIQRIKEAVSEIKQVARKDPVLAVDGAVRFLEKISGALEHVDSSSGAIGAAVNRAIASLAPIIGGTEVDHVTRHRWLERLWNAIQNDDMPYIEGLTDYWGELCRAPELASAWADEFIPIVERVLSPQASGHGHFKGTNACLSALFAAQRYEELLGLLAKARFKYWGERRWGVKALAAMGQKAEAIRYAEDSKGLNAPLSTIAETCEEILLSSGLYEEAYSRYALLANQGMTHLATFRAIAKKYPRKLPADILRDLVASQPGAEGKWFAAAKDVGLFDLAIELVLRSPTDPRTLIRAAKEFAVNRPDFAVESGMAALRWISRGHGYEITGFEVQEAYAAVMQAAREAGIDEGRVRDDIGHLIAATRHGSNLLRTALTRYFPE